MDLIYFNQLRINYVGTLMFPVPLSIMVRPCCEVPISMMGSEVLSLVLPLQHFRDKFRLAKL